VLINADPYNATTVVPLAGSLIDCSIIVYIHCFTSYYWPDPVISLLFISNLVAALESNFYPGNIIIELSSEVFLCLWQGPQLAKTALQPKSGFTINSAGAISDTFLISNGSCSVAVRGRLT
jgi:hypothetical protein